VENGGKWGQVENGDIPRLFGMPFAPLSRPGRRVSNWRRPAVAERREPVRGRDVQGLKYLDLLLPLLDE
jgi:hypothetical protein